MNAILLFQYRLECLDDQSVISILRVFSLTYPIANLHIDPNINTIDC